LQTVTKCPIVELVPLATLATRIRELRLKAGLSQETLAARAHIALRTVARLESIDNDMAPTQATITLLAIALNVHPDSLLYDDNGENEAA
jgi:transcriptional regulator with XRE-family HTH domain